MFLATRPVPPTRPKSFLITADRGKFELHDSPQILRILHKFVAHLRSDLVTRQKLHVESVLCRLAKKNV